MNGELSRAVVYTLGTLTIGVVVVLFGLAGLGMGGLSSLVVGASAAVAVQLVIYWILVLWAFRGRHGLAYSLGVLIRFAAVAAMAFVGVEVMGLTPAPTLLSMVACLFGSTLLEALILHRREMTRAGPGVATMR